MTLTVVLRPQDGQVTSADSPGSGSQKLTAAAQPGQVSACGRGGP